MTVRVWCDVGGTFTDTILEDERAGQSAQRSRIKVLSTGIVHAQILDWHDGSHCSINAGNEADQFWNGAIVRFHDALGNVVSQSVVSGYSSSTQTISLQDSYTLAQQASFASLDLDARIEAPVLATRLLLKIPIKESLPKDLDVRLGTTRGTNALLTRRGARVGFVTTAPFRDLLLIGNQDRPRLFDLEVVQRKPLYETAMEVRERILSDGSIEVPLNPQDVRAQLKHLQEKGIQSLAICLMNAYINDCHEVQVTEIAKELGFQDISTSSHIAPIARFVDRAETTVIDAYLSPVVRSYLYRLHQQFGGRADCRLRVMASSGGLVDFRSYSGKDSVLSGPAGGVVALQRISESLGRPKPAPIVGLDMGGTSTDVCRLQGEPNLSFEAIKADVRVLSPTLDIHTIAAGGGSICGYDGVQWFVGPQSAGADPGPACYGRGGPLTVTDLNVLTGRLPVNALPFAVDKGAAEAAINAAKLNSNLNHFSNPAVADGLRKIANEQMAAAVRAITIAQGLEPAEHILVGFGGAAGQHVCQVAEILGIGTVLDPPDAGVLSAMGMGLASISRMVSKSIYLGASVCTDSQIESHFHELQQQLVVEMQSEKIDDSNVDFERLVEVRTKGTDRTLSIVWRGLEELSSQFHSQHLDRYGYTRQELPLEITTLRLQAKSRSMVRWSSPIDSDLTQLLTIQNRNVDGVKHNESATMQCDLFHNEQWIKCAVRHRSELRLGEVIEGPCIVLSNSHTMVIEVGWRALVCEDGSIVARYLTRNTPSVGDTTSQPSSVETSSTDLLFREIMAQRFAAIASHMGIVLEQTAISVNIRDRRDFSCAVFDRNGQLLANAPHVPVHLGAMQATVEHAIRHFPSMQPGDSFITNDPFCGGSHLPDITVISPVFRPNSSQLAFFVANRAHHAEIGGIAPGSMAPTATRLIEEGVVIPMQYLTKAGEDCSDTIMHLLTTAKYPSRLPQQNAADLAAQSAANRRGVQALMDLIDEFHWDRISKVTEEVLEITATKVEHWIRSLAPWKSTFRDSLDDGTAIEVALEFSDHLKVDFTGTGPEVCSNFNASLGIVQAAVLYTIRVLMQDALPMNAGALRSVQLVVPPSILNPSTDREFADRPAVAAGNVETSQRVVDVLLGAMGVCGASQGTMNNLLMGNTHFGFYETIGGGTGATQNADGASAVHSHMTNTRLTDPEILEQRYPVRLRRLEVRTQSGGAGRKRGGDGMIREIEFLEPLNVTLVTSRRPPYQPYGQQGGSPGNSGRNALIDEQGHETELLACVLMQVLPHQRIRIETPGGGGFGEANNQD